MNNIFQIARAELKNLFYSPVAWFLAVAFFAQCAYFYSEILHGLALWQDNLKGNDVTFNSFGRSLTGAVFSSHSGVFSVVIRNLFLFLPLLTMGLISREVSSGSFQLLASSPVRIREIVLGKYLAIVTYNVILVLSLGLFIVFAFFSIENLDFGLLVAGILGIFLLISAYSAIGIFFSSLTTYQIVSAVAVFVTLYGLEMIGGMWQQYDFIRDLTYFLSMGGRTSKFIAGLVTSKDIIYYLLIMAMFVFFTMVRLKSKTESRPWVVNFVRYVGAFIIVLIIGYFSHRPVHTLYWDLTQNQSNTIHENTQRVLAQMGKEKVKVTLYANLLGGGFGKGGSPYVRNKYIHEFWERYLRFKPEIEFEYVNYYDIDPADSMTRRRYRDKTVEEIAELNATSHRVKLKNYLTPQQIKEIIDLDPEGNRLVMQLEYKGRKVFLRTFDDPQFWPNEMNLAAAIKRLLEEEPPLVVYATGNLERDAIKTGEREYGFQASSRFYRYSLINVGFDVDTVNLDYRDLPENTRYLVLADPKVDYSEKKIEKINAYLAAGGNAYILGEPGKQDVLNPVLNPLGVELGKGTLIEISKNESPHMVVPRLTFESLAMSEQYKYVIKNINEGKYVDTTRIYTPSTAPILIDRENTPFEVLSILQTESKRNTFSRVGKFVVDSVPPSYEPEMGDYKHPVFHAAVGLSRKIGEKEQRIILAGDADFGSNLRNAGGSVQIGFVTWLNNGELPVHTPTDSPIDVLFKITAPQALYQKYLLLYIIPGLLVLLGSVLLIRRKRK